MVFCLSAHHLSGALLEAEVAVPNTMQVGRQGKVYYRAKAQVSLPSSEDAPPSVPSAPPRVLPRPGKRPPLISSPLSQVKNYVHAKQLPLASRPSVFQSPDEDEEEDYEQWLEIKGKLQGLLAAFHHHLLALWAIPGQQGKHGQEFGVLGSPVR